jgi:hypothetical protein
VLDATVSTPSLLPQFSSQEAWLFFTLRLSVLPQLPVVAWSLCLALLLVGLHGLSEAFAQRWPSRGGRGSALLAWLCSLCALPYVAWVASQLFLGARAQLLPGRKILPFIAAVVLFLTVRGVAGLWLWAQERVFGEEPRHRRYGLGLGLAAVCLGLTLACYGLDRWMLPRLYPWFHLSLKLLAVSTAQATFFFGTGLLRVGLSPRRWTVVLGLALLILGWSAASLGRLYQATVLRGLVLERTTLGAEVMRVYAAWRARGRASVAIPLPAAGSAADDEPVPPVYSGPRLDGHDVFLITVDALRYDRLRPEVMPFTSALCRRGVVFEHAYTQVPHTSLAVATLLTGKPVYGLMAMGHEAASHETLPLVLRRFGYKTAAFYPPSVFYIEHERLKSTCRRRAAPIR